jgi:pimeloyl-ACP methyl ester carboxylesterase
MSDFLLVHGSCHGAWAFDRLIPELEALGHTARAIDLPSHGEDKTPPREVTLDLYAEAILAAIDEPTIVVGHSMAGYPLTRAADLSPEKFRRLIYLCAYVPMAGKSLAEMRRMAPRQPLNGKLVIDEERITFAPDLAQIGPNFFGGADPETMEWALSRLCPQPILPQETPVWPAASRDLPRRYIRCLQDETIPPEFQATMTEDWPADTVATINTGHAPFLSMPGALARLLERLAKD